MQLTIDLPLRTHIIRQSENLGLQGGFQAVQYSLR